VLRICELVSDRSSSEHWSQHVLCVSVCGSLYVCLLMSVSLHMCVCLSLCASVLSATRMLVQEFESCKERMAADRAVLAQQVLRLQQQIQAGAVPAYFPPDLLLELKQQGQGSPGSPQSPLDIAQHATQHVCISHMWLTLRVATILLCKIHGMSSALWHS